MQEEELDLCPLEEGGDVEMSLSWFIAGPLTLIFSVISTWGNLYSIRILRTLSIRRSIRVYLLVLAIANTSICQCSFWYYALNETISPIFGNVPFLQFLTIFFHPLTECFVTLSVWMILTVTVDRYLALSRPLQHRAHDSPRRARMTTAIIVILALIYSSPKALELRLSDECSIKRGDNFTSLEIMPTALRLNESYNLWYNLVLSSFFIFIGPSLLITALSIKMMFIVLKARRERVGMDARLTVAGKMNQGENTTIMLLTVIVKFLLGNTLMFILIVWERIQTPQEANASAAFKLCVELSNILVVANSSTDAIVYLRWKKKHHASHASYSAIQRTLFTADEAALIQKRYAQRRPNLSTHIASSMMALAGFEVNESRMALEGKRVDGILDSMVRAVGDVSGEQKLIFLLNELGAKHRSVTIPPNAWNRFKAIILNELAQNDDRQLWSRFACLLIKEFRNGQSSSCTQISTSPKQNSQYLKIPDRSCSYKTHSSYKSTLST